MQGGLCEICQGQQQAHGVVELAGATALLQRIVEQRRDRRIVDKLQALHQGPFDGGVDFHHGFVQVGNAGAAARQLQAGQPRHPALGLANFHAHAVKDQIALQPRERRPVFTCRAGRHGWHVSKLHIAGFGGHQKLALLRVGKRDFAKITFDLEFHFTQLALRDRIPHIASA